MNSSPDPMAGFSMDKTQRKRIAILQVLKEEGRAVPSSRITEILTASGEDFSERTVRFYLKEMDRDGLTLPNGRRGRVITEAGLVELHAASTLDRVGYLSAKIDRMTYRMSFDLPTCSGDVIVNTSVVRPTALLEHVDDVCRVFSAGFAMGTRAGLVGPGERVGDLLIPDGMVGLCTVCSITLNGVLLKHGIPTTSRFAGLLEIQRKRPVRFVEMIHYDGTSVDPLEMFIRAGMTDYLTAIREGNGQIGAGFREVPVESRELISHLAERLEKIGLGAFMEIGMPGRSVLGVPVTEGRIGAVVIGGLNPIAVLEESGVRVASRALAGLMEFNRLFPFEELPGRLARLSNEAGKSSVSTPEAR